MLTLFLLPSKFIFVPWTRERARWVKKEDNQQGSNFLKKNNECSWQEKHLAQVQGKRLTLLELLAFPRNACLLQRGVESKEHH